MGAAIAKLLSHLSAGLKADATAVFNAMDVDKDGSLTVDELTQAARMSKADATATLAGIDKDGNGSVSLDEFLAYFGKIIHDGKTEADARAELSKFRQNTGDLVFHHVHIFADELLEVPEYLAMEAKMNKFVGKLDKMGGGDTCQIAEARGAWETVEKAALDPEKYTSQNQDVVKQLISGMNWRVTASNKSDKTSSVLVTSRDAAGAKFVVTARNTGEGAAKKSKTEDAFDHFNIQHLDRFYQRTAARENCPGIGVLAFECGPTNSAEAVFNAYKAKHPKLLAQDAVKTYEDKSFMHSGFYKVVEVFAYYEADGKGNPDMGTILRFVERNGSMATVTLPGLEGVKAEYNSMTVPAYSDHWVSNVKDRQGFLATLEDTLGFTPKVDFNAGVVAAGEAIIESTVTGNASTFIAHSPDEGLPNQSQIYLPINNAISSVGHVAAYLEEIGQGVQHIASRVSDLVKLISRANRLRQMTGEGFTFLRIPMSYYGFLSVSALQDSIMADNSGRLLGTVAAKEAIAKLQAAGLVNNMGIVNLDITDAEIAAAGVEGGVSKSFVAMVKKARYSNIYKLLGDHLNAATYVEIVRNNILVDIQGQDVLYQIFTANILQRNPGEQAPFLEFIQRVCSEKEDEEGNPVPVKPGCGGFGIRNFLTLFLSIEVNKAMLEIDNATTSGDPKALDVAQRQMQCLTHQLDESNPVLTQIADGGTAEAEAQEAINAAKTPAAKSKAENELAAAQAMKTSGSDQLKEISARHASEMKAIRETK